MDKMKKIKNINFNISAILFSLYLQINSQSVDGTEANQEIVELLNRVGLQSSNISISNQTNVQHIDGDSQSTYLNVKFARINKSMGIDLKSEYEVNFVIIKQNNFNNNVNQSYGWFNAKKRDI